MCIQNTGQAGPAQAAANTPATNTNAAPDAIVGLTLHLPDKCKCSGTIALIGGTAPHCALLHCALCDAHRGWVSRGTYDFIAEIADKSGRPTAPIVIRHVERIINSGSKLNNSLQRNSGSGWRGRGQKRGLRCLLMRNRL
jgi:hypothetical protein